MAKINWLAKKSVDYSNIEKYLQASRETNQYTNSGPMVRQLEAWLTKKLAVDEDRAVIAVANGAVGLHVLAASVDIVLGKEHQYVTSDFTFPCSAQGYLKDSLICDIDEDGNLDLDLVQGDGLIVTNLFGHLSNIRRYLDFCEAKSYPCLFDNACACYSFYQGSNAVNYGDGCIISLHHTKPIGFGEGGLIILKKKYELTARKLLNFGFEIKNGNVVWHKSGTNAKMSDVSASFIYDYVTTNFDYMIQNNTSLYTEFQRRLSEIPKVKLLTNYSDNVPFVNCLPLICQQEITGIELHNLDLHGITARKYYVPLTGQTQAQKLFQHILCLPLHMDMTIADINKYIDVLKQL